ncbi:MAG: hypothetical protein AB8G22_09255 [Saprospiraceae bacterium]
MMKKTALLTTPLFLIALTLLLLNDFYLKSTYGNFLTGKLSDVAGLFVFPLFFYAFFPKWKKYIFVGTALLFCWWKSPLSNSFIELMNMVGIMVDRVIDYSDCWALLILPIAYWHTDFKLLSLRFVPKVIVSGIAIFAFAATSLAPLQQVTFEEVNRTYEFKIDKRELINRLNSLAIDNLKRFGALAYSLEDDQITSHWTGDTLAVLLDASLLTLQDTVDYRFDVSREMAVASLVVSGDSIQSQLKVLRMLKMTGSSKRKKLQEKTIEYFEKKIIKRLRAGEKGHLY